MARLNCPLTINFARIIVACVLAFFSVTAGNVYLQCKLGKNYRPPDYLDNYHEGCVLTVSNWQAIYEKRQLYHCNWKFKQDSCAYYFDLSQVVLDSNDKLIINGSDLYGKTAVLFTFTGTPPSGLVNLAGYDYINVSLEIAPTTDSSLDIDSRIFNVIYYADRLIPLQHHMGQLTIPLNLIQKPIWDTTIAFKANGSLANQLVMLNFTQLPVNASGKSILAVDGVPLTATSRKLFLQSPSKPNITLSLTLPVEQADPLVLTYWLVDRRCSGKKVLKIGKQPSRIAFPETSLLGQQGSPVRCCMAFSTEMGENKLVVSLPSPASLHYLASTMHFLDVNGHLLWGLNSHAGDYFRKTDTLIEATEVIVLREASLVSRLYGGFEAPTIKAVPNQANKILFIKEIPIKVKFNTSEQAVHLVIAKEDFIKNVLLGFPGAKGATETKQYNFDSFFNVSVDAFFQYISKVTFAKSDISTVAKNNFNN